jgi:chemotaxis protein MotD
LRASATSRPDAPAPPRAQAPKPSAPADRFTLLLTETAHAGKKNAAKTADADHAAAPDSRAAKTTKTDSKGGQTARPSASKSSAGEKNTRPHDAEAEHSKPPDAVSDSSDATKETAGKKAAGTDDARKPDDKSGDKATADDKAETGTVDGLATQVAAANPQVTIARQGTAGPDTTGANASRQPEAIRPAARGGDAATPPATAPDGKPPETPPSAAPAAGVPAKTANGTTKPEAQAADKSAPDAGQPQPPQTAAPQIPIPQTSLAQTPPAQPHITQHVTVSDAPTSTGGPGATPAAAGLIRPDLPGLAVSIAARSLGGARQFDIRLDPPELGHVEVRLSIDAAGKTSAHLSADQPQTLDLLQRDAGSLARALRDAGLDLSQNSLNFSLRQQGGHSAGDGGSRSASRGRARNLIASRTLQPVSGVSVSYRAPLDGRLDIKV